MTMRLKLLLTCILTLAAGGLLSAADRVDVPELQTPLSQIATPVANITASSGEQVLAPLQSTSSRVNYNCWLRVFVVEPHSRWTDNTGYYHYDFGFLDFGLDTSLSLAYQESFESTRNWTCPTGLGSISEDNIMVIAVLFNKESSGVNYSDPPSGAAFNIYGADAAASATPGVPGYDTAYGNSTHTVFLEEATQQG